MQLKTKSGYLKIRDLPPDERPREKMKNSSPENLSNSELLAIILEKGSKSRNVLDLSKEIMASQNIEELSRENVRSLCKIKGIGLAKACQIVACFELGRRLSGFNREEQPILSSPEQVYRLLAPSMKSQRQENFVCIFLDTRKRLIRKETLFIGTLDSSLQSGNLQQQ